MSGATNFKDTFPKLLLLNAAERGGRAAIREKDLGATKSLNIDADDAITALEKKEIDAAFIMTESASNDDIR